MVHDGGHAGEQCLLVDLAAAKQSSRLSIKARSAQPRGNYARRSCARIASMATRAMSVGARMLPKPTNTGGVQR